MSTRQPDHMPGILSQRWLAWLRRRWLLLLVLSGFLALVIARRTEIEQALLTLVEGRWPWILAAILLQGAFYLAYAVEYHLSFATMRVETQVPDLVPVLLASIFVKAVVPSGGLSALAVFADDAARRGRSPVRTAQGALLVMVADLVAVAPLVFWGLNYLAGRQVLRAYQVIASGILLLVALTLAGVISLGRWLPHLLHGTFASTQGALNGVARWVRRPPPLPPGWAQRQADDYVGAARGLGENPRLLGQTLGMACLANLANLATLYALTLAYRQPVALGALVAAHMLNIVFSIVTIVPHGIGVAEGVMALALSSLGVPAATALAITVAFRGLNLWLPLSMGFFSLRRVRSFGGGGSG